MADLQMGALTDLEVAEAVDQGLASLHARLEDPNEPGPGELREALERACDEWDRFADLLPGFRAEG